MHIISVKVREPIETRSIKEINQWRSGVEVNSILFTSQTDTFLCGSDMGAKRTEN